jgi:prolyl oligopeptidase
MVAARAWTLAFLIGFTGCHALSKAPPAPTSPPAGPLARADDTVETRFGVTLIDPYRWLEGDDNPEAAAWMRAQGAHADAWLAELPGRERLLAELHARDRDLARDQAGDLRTADGRRFFLRRAAGATLSDLVVREPDGQLRTLATTPPSDGEVHSAIQTHMPSPDGRFVAYNLATGGSELATIVVVEVARGVTLGPGVGRTWGDAPVTWLPDSSGFAYVELAEPRPGRDPLLDSTLRLHRLDPAAGPDLELLDGRGPAFALAPEEFGQLTTTAGSAWLVARATLPRSEERIAVAPTSALDRAAIATPWRVVADYDDKVAAAFVHGDRLYVTSWKDAPNGRLLSLPLTDPDLAAARIEVTEDPEAVLTVASAARDAMYYVMTRAGRSRLYRRSWDGGPATEIALPEPGKIYWTDTDPLTDGVTFHLATWLRPRTYYTYAPTTDRVVALALTATPAGAVEDDRFVAELVEATSADGTRVPMTILRRRDLVLDGTAPAILEGYGGYGISLDPWFQAEHLVWLDRGGVLAFAHVRGGGEKGRRWYRAGQGANKPRGVADFVACAQHLIDRGYSRADRLAAYGNSMGGLLVGMAVTTRPSLFAAAHLAGGEVNPVRMLHARNGASQKAELGDPDTPDGLRQVAAIDPYHHVRDGQRYPAMIVTVGLNDQRVSPWMSAKLVARLRAARPDGAAVLLRIDAEAGHGRGSTRAQELALVADVWSFFLAAAGAREFSPRDRPR